MNRLSKALILVCLLFLSFSFSGRADDTGKQAPDQTVARAQQNPIALTEGETREALQAADLVQALQGELQQRWLDVLQAPLERAVEVVAKAQLYLPTLADGPESP